MCCHLPGIPTRVLRLYCRHHSRSRRRQRGRRPPLLCKIDALVSSPKGKVKPCRWPASRNRRGCCFDEPRATGIGEDETAAAAFPLIQSYPRAWARHGLALAAGWSPAGLALGRRLGFRRRLGSRRSWRWPPTWRLPPASSRPPALDRFLLHFILHRVERFGAGALERHRTFLYACVATSGERGSQDDSRDSQTNRRMVVSPEE